MLVWRIAGPVSAGRIDLDHHQLIGRKVGGDDVDDLPRRVSATAQAGHYVFWGDQPRLQLCLRRNAALCDFANGCRVEFHGMAGWEIYAVGKSIEDVFAAADLLVADAPIGGTAAPEDYERSFFAVGHSLIGLAGIQTSRRHAHPLPMHGFAGKP